MEYRDIDYENDLDKVVQLINKNLDPHYTKDFLLWKHYHNPLGRSFAMVATDAEKIVGVIFLIQYHFRSHGNIEVKAVRPVDVSTDAEYRGRGIFTKLIVECLKNHRNDFKIAFATANHKSYPAFIKMGWDELQLDYNVGIFSPLVLFGSKKLIDFQFDESHNRLLNYHNFGAVGNNLQFMKWRYKKKDYKIKKFQKNGKTSYVIYRLDTRKGVNFILLCDFYGNLDDIDEIVKNVCALEKVFIVYYLDNPINKRIKFFYERKVNKVKIVYKGDGDLFKNDMILSLGDLEAKI